jgi:flagellar motility protein MotE (MotC chaperone)
MLTKEILQANDALSALSDEQISAIVTLSQNDENTVIAQKTGEIYGALDNDILSVSGIGKNGTEKTYAYAKRVLGELKTKAADADILRGTVDSLTKEKERLEKAIADGAGDAEAAKQLKQAKADLANITQEYNTLNTKFQEQETKHKQELFDLHVNTAIQSASSGLKFKQSLPESVTKVILQQASEKLKAMNPEYVDDGKGGKALVFKGQDGAILRNPNNQLNPYTVSELLHKELDAMDVLEKGRKAKGAGTGCTNGGGKGNALDVSGARTRVEAYDLIRSALLAQGLTASSQAYQDAFDAAWKENNISALPEQ